MDTNIMKNVAMPIQTFDSIPEPKANAKSIVAVVKQSGKVCGYQLSDGTTITKEEGINLAKQGQISGVGIANRNGNEYLKTIPDGNEGNNLSSLPTVKTTE